MTSKFTHRGVVNDFRVEKFSRRYHPLRELKLHWVDDRGLKFRKSDGSCIVGWGMTLDLSSIKPVGGGK